MPNREWMTKDLTWKLFSLILAVGLWITIHNLRETPEAAVTPFATVTTVTFTNLPVLAVSASADVHNAQIVPNLDHRQGEWAVRCHGGFAGNNLHAIGESYGH